MKYYSLNQSSPSTSFKEAAILGQAPDKGLYFPERIPLFANDFLARLKNQSAAESAFEVIKPYVGDSIDEAALYSICEETMNFPFPLVSIQPRIASLELFHGPTLAFKDVGARFMSRCLGYFSKNNDRKITVLVATSGDTGGAVANGFLGVPGVEVVILYPKNRVSKVQEQQLTALGQNIKALEVSGTFDDCQRLVKHAFTDENLKRDFYLTSANSINIARWLPQQFYYLEAYKQWQGNEAPVICVPSGNFGNIAAGMMAWKSGLPVKHFIAACNANDTVPRYMNSGNYSPMQAHATLSNAMDVGDPSNFVRMLKIFDNDFSSLSQMVSSVSVSDKTTMEMLKTVYETFGYMLDPHGAVAYAALHAYNKEHHSEGYILETAHPVKFDTTVRDAVGKEVELPEELADLMKQPKHSIEIAPEYGALLEALRS
jgi:threonine synthase